MWSPSDIGKALSALKDTVTLLLFACIALTVSAVELVKIVIENSDDCQVLAWALYLTLGSIFAIAFTFSVLVLYITVSREKGKSKQSYLDKIFILTRKSQ